MCELTDEINRLKKKNLQLQSKHQESFEKAERLAKVMAWGWKIASGIGCIAIVGFIAYSHYFDNGRHFIDAIEKSKYTRRAEVQATVEDFRKEIDQQSEAMLEKIYDKQTILKYEVIQAIVEQRSSPRKLAARAKKAEAAAAEVMESE